MMISLPCFRVRRIPQLAALLLAASAPIAPAEPTIPIPIPRPEFVPPAAMGKAPSFAKSKAMTGIALTLADVVFLGLRDNRTIKSAYIDRIAQKFSLHVAEDRFTPQLAVSGSVARQRIGGVNSTVIDVSPGITLLTQTGAVFDFAWSNAATLGEDSRTLTSAAEMKIEQPLLRGAGTEVNLAPIERARLGERINKLRLRATVSEVIGTIIFAYRDLLLAQEELTLAERAVDRTEDLLRINRTLIKAGRMAAMDAVQTEADLANQQLRVLQATQQIDSTRFTLVNLLGLELTSKIVAVETLAPRKIETAVGKLLPVALAQRQDYQGQLYVIEQNRLGIVVAKNEQLWDISLFVRGRFGSDLASNRPTSDIADVAAGLRFKFPLNDLAKQQQLVDATTGYQSAELQLADIRAGVEMQVRSSAAEAAILWKQLALAQKSVELANQAVDIEKTKLNAGRSTTFQVRLLEESLRTSENQLLTARIGYLNALTRLDLQLGTTLDTWRIALKD